MNKLILAVAAFVVVSSPALALSEGEARQLQGLLNRRSVEVLGPHRPDNRGPVRILGRGQSGLDNAGCRVIATRHDSQARGTFRRVVCTRRAH
jgi:hypothetical protein